MIAQKWTISSKLVIKSITIFKVSPKKVAMNAFFSVEIKKIGNLDKFHI